MANDDPQSPEEQRIENWLYRQFNESIRQALGKVRTKPMIADAMNRKKGEEAASLIRLVYDVVIALHAWHSVAEAYADRDEVPDYNEQAAVRVAASTLAGQLMLIAYARGGIGDPYYDPATLPFEDPHEELVAATRVMREAQSRYFKERSQDHLVAAKQAEAVVDRLLKHATEDSNR